MGAALFLTGTALFVLGLGGALVRRSLLVTLLAFELAAMGAVVVLVGFALPAGDPDALARAVVLLFVAVAHAVLGAAVAIAIFRRRGTLNLDELRELEG